MTVNHSWHIGGGTLTLSYTGEGNSSISLSSTVNEGVDRSVSVKVETTDKRESREIIINQLGKREYLLDSQGDIYHGADEEFLVLKS